MPITKSEDIKAFRCPLCNKLIEIVNGGKEYVTIHGSLTIGDRIPFIGNLKKYHSDSLKTPIDCIEESDSIRICISCLIKKLGGMDFLGRDGTEKLPSPQFIGMPEGPWDDLNKK